MPIVTRHGGSVAKSHPSPLTPPPPRDPRKPSPHPSAAGRCPRQRWCASCCFGSGSSTPSWWGWTLRGKSFAATCISPTPYTWPATAADVHKFPMTRKKPAPRVVVQRSRNNANRRLIDVVPSTESRRELSVRVNYDGYSKHKINPRAYKLRPYAGQDEERTYCDAHANFGKENLDRIPALLVRGVMLGLWSAQTSGDVPSLLWTVAENGWIFELRITNADQAQYHGYPVLPGDAFARHVLNRARAVAHDEREFPVDKDSTARSAIAAAEIFYR